MNYLEFDFVLEPVSPWSDILKAYLVDIGFDSFVDSEHGFQAYIPEKDFDEQTFMNVEIINGQTETVKCSINRKKIEAQNWNATWEASFEPVVIANDLAIVAPFHSDYPKTKYTLIIEPKMSFGTGHHQTTKLMSRALMDLGHIPQRVLDMGCGTGVLAILAEKIGVSEVLAIDIEEWAFENTMENAERNACNKIQAQLGDIDLLHNQKPFDLILANINKNVLSTHLTHYADKIVPSGVLLLSGFFVSDSDELIESASHLGFELSGLTSQEQWCCLKFNRKNNQLV